MQAERRKRLRSKVKDNAFAVINPDPVEMAPIIDIAMGELCIYVDNGAKWMNDCPKLEIMVADCSFYLHNPPFEIIANQRYAITNSPSGPHQPSNVQPPLSCIGY